MKRASLICSAMDQRITAGRLMLTGFALMVFMSSCAPSPQSLPSDAQDACPLSLATFQSWFQSGSGQPVTLNGVVNPADSVNFPGVPNCDFYRWSEQMFMWLNSPAPPSYGGGDGRIFNSPAFFDVSPLQADGTRLFLPHTPGGSTSLSLRVAQVGPHGLPVVLDRSGQLVEIEQPEKGAKPLVRDVSGQLVEIAHARRGDQGKLILLDKGGKEINAQREEVSKRSAVNRVPVHATRFIIDRIPIFLDPSLSVIDVEQDQADGSVLEAQNNGANKGSLVYFAIMVNDVYAYFATAQKNGAIAASQFPVSATDLANITSFASAHGKTFPDPNALAVEVKSAWVEAAGLPNLNSYITMTATIPTYDMSNSNQWTLTGQKTVQLALVGMHVVGSTGGPPNGHPEMIWATFEHIANAPRATYSYINTSNSTVTVNQNIAATWLFSANGSSGPFNMRMLQNPSLQTGRSRVSSRPTPT